MIGKLYNKEAEAKKAIAEIEQLITETKEKGAKSEKKALFVMVNDGSLSVFGASGRFGALPFNIIGLKSADESIESGRHGQRINYEYLAIKNPDIMHILDRSKAIGQEAKSSQLLDNALVKRTKAVKNNDVDILDGSTWYSPIATDPTWADLKKSGAAKILLQTLDESFFSRLIKELKPDIILTSTDQDVTEKKFMVSKDDANQEVSLNISSQKYLRLFEKADMGVIIWGAGTNGAFKGLKDEEMREGMNRIIKRLNETQFPAL